VIAFTASGTGGHIYPCIALAEELAKDKTYFICSQKRKDKEIIAKYGFNFFSLSGERKNPVKIMWNILKARKILKREKTKLLISAGGYFTFPIVLAAFSLRIPIFLLEQNILSGRVNRYLAIFATKVFLSFPQSERYFSKKKAVFSGNPIRRFSLKDAVYHALLKVKLPESSFKILVFGGSQGSLAINKIFFDNYDYFLDQDLIIIQVTGADFYQKVAEKYQNSVSKNNNFLVINDKKGENRIIVLPYFENMEYLYKLADLVVSRSGATTVSELMAFQKKAILVPFPFAKDNHQFYNAKFYEDLGLGKLVLEQDLTFSVLLDEINQFKQNRLVAAKEISADFSSEKAKEIIFSYLNV
jgi:UDP-N-acetylglucosamine--N-acetylmuramyl-(pentapeptide) pyrophosphoryl-undecaprenol N-acetylglucosamine transferase